MAKKQKKRKAKTQLEPGDYLDAEQVRFVLEILRSEAKNGSFRTAVRLFIFQLLVNTGLRRSEAVGLQLRDLPGAHGKSEIVVRWELSKSRRNRGVIISDSFKTVLASYVERFCKNQRDTAPLLLNEHGRQMTPRNIFDRIKTIGRHVGITGLHPHTMRHTHLSLLYGIDKDQMFVKHQAGHSKLDTTNIYVHISDAGRKRQVSKLDWLV